MNSAHTANAAFRPSWFSWSRSSA